MTTTATTAGAARIGRLAIVIVGLLVAAAGVYVLAVPVDPADFEATADQTWQSVVDASPQVAAYLEREARLLGVGYVGFGLLVAAVGWLLVPVGGQRAVAVLWLAPLTLGAAAVVFLAGGGVALGAFYAVVAIAAVLAVGTLTLRGPAPARGP